MSVECRIRVLDEEVANKIAAGEVVERPASVVKELLENAVDAGATRILVEVEGGGRELIRITDNGCGMTPQEAVLSLQRHATSKIARAEDLAAVRTLGFRGEALPSIASVSRLTLLTRARGSIEGVRMEAEAGEIRELEPAGAAEGTVLAVRDLFYNTPARLKFLKTTRTELGQICDVVTRLALSHPGISVRLVADGEELLHAPGSADPLNTVTALYGKEVARELAPVALSRPGLAVEGYVSLPTLTRPTRSAQHLFVNGRWVRNRTLTHALDEAFRAAIPSGRFPFAVLHVEIDPALVDVNVHPAKSEVRFLRDWEVHRAVHEAVRQALGAPEGTVPERLARQHALSPEMLQTGPWLPPTATAPTGTGTTSDDPFAEADPGATAPWRPAQGPDLELQPPPGLEPAHPPVAGRAGAPVQPEIPELGPPVRASRPVAQLWGSYIVAEGPAGLLLIDQHLAHERILFDRLRGEDAAPQQALAAPLTLQLTHREALLVDELLPELARVGFGLEPFGRDAFVVRAVPPFVPAGDELATLRQVLDELAEARRAGSGGGPSLREQVAASTACRAAVKKGTRLGLPEMGRLLEDLAGTTNPHTCPHGCPIAIEISYQELLRRFKRI